MPTLLALSLAFGAVILFWRRARWHLTTWRFWVLLGALFVSLSWAQSAAVYLAGPFPWDAAEAGWMSSLMFLAPLGTFVAVYLLQPAQKSDAAIIRSYLQKRLVRATLDSDDQLTKEIEKLSLLLSELPQRRK